MGLAEKREHMMLAERIEIEILAQDHFLIFGFAENRAVDGIFGILSVTAAQKLVCTCDPLRRARQTLAIGILTDVAKDGANRFLDFSAGRFVCGPSAVSYRCDGLPFCLRHWLNSSASSIASEGPPPLMMLKPATSVEI